tara:strand:+ start:7018 stop:7392 length:375 start_codon:yes stop_codon:yes gene_type:complete
MRNKIKIKKNHKSNFIYETYQVLEKELSGKYSKLEILNYADKLVKFQKNPKVDKSLNEDVQKFYQNYLTLNLSNAFKNHQEKIVINESKNAHIEYEDKRIFQIKENFERLNNSSYSIFDGLVSL